MGLYKPSPLLVALIYSTGLRNTFVTLKKLNVVFAQKRKVSQGSNHISRRQSSRESNHVSKFAGDNQLSPKKQGDNHGETHQDVEYMQLQDDYNSALINKCQCSGLSCLRDVDCNHGGNYVKDSQSEELVLNPEKLQELIYECTSLCACKQKKCVNRLVQYGPRNNLKIIYSERYQSKAIFSKNFIKAGEELCFHYNEGII
uniref:Pre-SET domain-containing protein n=1 Tax=Glossina palpalis gambiensis TaxID=67801 RepID=A0A1B0BUB2_9MUSC